MAKRREKLLSEQLRNAIRDCGLSQYRVGKDADIDLGQLCRFMGGNGRLGQDAVDRLGQVLGLTIVAQSSDKRNGR